MSQLLVCFSKQVHTSSLDSRLYFTCLLFASVHGSRIAIYFIFKLYCFLSSTLPLVISLYFHIVIISNYRYIDTIRIDIAIFSKHRIVIVSKLKSWYRPITTFDTKAVDHVCGAQMEAPKLTDMRYSIRGDVPSSLVPTDEQ